MDDNRDLPSIRMLVLTLTGRCNFTCQYCYASEQAECDMTEETALMAIKMAGMYGERFLLQFSGGEPLLQFPLIRKIVHQVEENHWNAQMQIQTNGSLLTKEIGKWLYEHHVGIGISCDGRPKVMNRVRKLKNGQPSSSVVSAAFQSLAEVGIETGITCVVTDDVVEELDGIVEMAYFYGNVHQIGFDILREQGKGRNLKAPTGMQMLKALEKTTDKLDALQKLTGKKVYFTQEDRVNMLRKTGNYEFPQCFAMHGEAAFVDVNGYIYACSSLMGHKEYCIGTVREGRNKIKLKEVAYLIEKAMQPCRRCEYFRLCGGGCFSRWLDKNGKIRISEAECTMKKFFIKRYLQKHGEVL